MSSSNDDDQRKTTTSDPASNNFSGHPHETVPGGYPQNHHHHHPPQQMGHPPPIGYPPPGPAGYPPNYNPYPYPPAPLGYYPNPYQHPPHPPPHHMHHPHHHHGPMIQSTPSRVAGFLRGFLIAIIILIMISCIFSIVLYILLRPMVPEYHVTSFTVTNFNISNGVVAGNWDANITVTNPNPNQKVDFNRMQAYMYYRNIVHYLSWSTMESMSLGTNNSTSSFHVRNTMANQAQPPEWTMKHMEEDWEKGVVKFELGMTMLAKFKGSWWISHLSLAVYCDDLMVSFQGPKAGLGSIAPGELPKKCVVDA